MFLFICLISSMRVSYCPVLDLHAVLFFWWLVVTLYYVLCSGELCWWDCASCSGDCCMWLIFLLVLSPCVEVSLVCGTLVLPIDLRFLDQDFLGASFYFPQFGVRNVVGCCYSCSLFRKKTTNDTRFQILCDIYASLDSTTQCQVFSLIRFLVMGCRCCCCWAFVICHRICNCCCCCSSCWPLSSFFCDSRLALLLASYTVWVFVCLPCYLVHACCWWWWWC